MKKIALILTIACCVFLAGCSKDAEINAFITELDSTTADMVKAVDASPNKAGVEAAQKVFDGKKASLKTKWDGFKDAVGFQVSADVKKKLEDSVMKDTSAITGLIDKHEDTLGTDIDGMNKLTALMKDFGATFTPPSGSK